MIYTQHCTKLHQSLAKFDPAAYNNTHLTVTKLHHAPLTTTTEQHHATHYCTEQHLYPLCMTAPLSTNSLITLHHTRQNTGMAARHDINEGFVTRQHNLSRLSITTHCILYKLNTTIIMIHTQHCTIQQSCTKVSSSLTRRHIITHIKQWLSYTTHHIQPPPSNIMPYTTAPCNTMPYTTAPRNTKQHTTAPSHTLLHHATPSNTLLHHATSSHTSIHSAWLHHSQLIPW